MLLTIVLTVSRHVVQGELSLIGTISVLTVYIILQTDDPYIYTYRGTKCKQTT